MRTFIFVLLFSINCFSAGYKNASWGESKSSVQKKLKPEKKDTCSFSFYSTTAEGQIIEQSALFPGMKLSSVEGCYNANVLKRCQKKVYSLYSTDRVGIGCGIFFENKYVGQFNHLFEATGPLLEELKKKYGEAQELGNYGSKSGAAKVYLFKDGTTNIYAFESFGKSDLSIIYSDPTATTKAAKLEREIIEKLKNKNSNGKNQSLQNAKDSL